LEGPEFGGGVKSLSCQNSVRFYLGSPPLINPAYTIPATVDFHVDAKTGWEHFKCANTPWCG